MSTHCRHSLKGCQNSAQKEPGDSARRLFFSAPAFHLEEPLWDAPVELFTCRSCSLPNSCLLPCCSCSKGVACAGKPQGASLDTKAHVCVSPKQFSTGPDLGSACLEAQATAGRRQLPERSSVYLVTVGQPGAAAPFWPYNLNNSVRVWLKPSCRAWRIGGIGERPASSGPALAAVLQWERRPPAMDTALCMSPAPTPSAGCPSPHPPQSVWPF